MVDLTGVPIELQDEYDQYIPMVQKADRPERDEFTAETYDALISAEVLLPKEEILTLAKVIGCKHDLYCQP